MNIYKRYLNVYRMLIDRKYHVPSQLTYDEFQLQYGNHSNNIIINGNDYNVIIIQNKKFKKKLYTKIVKNIKIRKLIIIIIDPKIEKRHIKIINEDTNHDTELIESVYFNFHLTKHEAVPLHILHKDSSILEKQSTLKLMDLPRILISDPLSKWYGAKPNQIFEIHRTNGYENPVNISYRRVVDEYE